MPNLASLFNSLRAAGTNVLLEFSFSWRELEDQLKRPCKICDQGPEFHGKPRRFSHLVGEAQLPGGEVFCWRETRSFSNNVQGSFRTLSTTRL